MEMQCIYHDGTRTFTKEVKTKFPKLMVIEDGSVTKTVIGTAKQMRKFCEYMKSVRHLYFDLDFVD